MGGSDLVGGGGVEFWRVEAQRWRVEAQRLAADEALLRARVADLEGQVGALAEKVSVLARMVFGTSSEKAARPAPGGDGATGGAGGAGGDDPAGGREKRGRGQRRGARGHGRRDYSHLPTREEIHDVPEAERWCPRCGAGYVRFGQECCEQIDWQVQLTRIVHRRPTYQPLVVAAVGDQGGVDPDRRPGREPARVLPPPRPPRRRGDQHLPI